MAGLAVVMMKESVVVAALKTTVREEVSKTVANVVVLHVALMGHLVEAQKRTELGL